MRRKFGLLVVSAFSVLTLVSSASVEAQGAQTDIPWLEEVAEAKPDATQPAAPGTATPSDNKALKFRPGASLFSRYELRRNYAGLEPIDERIRDFDAVAYRARIILRTEPIQLAKGFALELAVVPQSSGFWAPSGANTDATIALHEGYIRPWFGDRAWLQAGRFEMSYGDEWLIGANGWHETGRSFDGLRFHVGAAKSAAFFDAFVSLLREGRAGVANTSDDRVSSGDEMLFGLYGDLGPLLSDKLHLDPYALLIMAPRSNRYYAEGATAPVKREAAYEATVGLRVAGGYGLVDYRVEGGIQFGERTNDAAVQDALAGAVDAELGFNLPATIRVGVGGSFASGDDPTTGNKNEGWADRFSQPHKWLGLSDVFRSRSNVLGPMAVLSASPLPGLDFGVQGHFLFKHRVLDPNVALGAKPEANTEFAGIEVDPYIGFAFAKGLVLRSEYGVFIASEDAYGDHKAAHYFGLQFGYHNPG